MTEERRLYLALLAIARYTNRRISLGDCAIAMQMMARDAVTEYDRRKRLKFVTEKAD